MKSLAKIQLCLALLTPVSGRAAGLSWQTAWVTTGAGRGTADWIVNADVSWHGSVSLSRAKSTLARNDAPIGSVQAAIASGSLPTASLNDIKKPWDRHQKPASPAIFNTPSFPGFATINAGTLLMNGTLAAVKGVDLASIGSLPFGATCQADEDSADDPPTAPFNAPSYTLDISDSSPLALTQLAAGGFADGSPVTLVRHRGGWVNTELLALVGAGFGDDSVLTLDPAPLFERFDRHAGVTRANAPNLSAAFGEINVVPEPSTGLFVILIGAMAMRRRRTDRIPS
jgi:hypothetical protein